MSVLGGRKYFYNKLFNFENHVDNFELMSVENVKKINEWCWNLRHVHLLL